MTSAAAPAVQFWRRRRLPVIVQSESAECGLVCLAMVASYWGHRMDLAAMRRRFTVSLKGATLKSLIRMGDALGLASRPLKLEMDALPKLTLPCLLHWDMNHFVVLSEVSSKGAVIHDPASGRRSMRLDELSRHFTGVALELIPGGRFVPRRETASFTLLSLIGNVVGLKRGIAQILLVGLALQVCSLVAPFYLQWIVDDALTSADHGLVGVLGAGFLLLVMLQAAMTAVRSWMTTALATNLNFQWFGNAFTHMMRLPLPFFEKRHLGDIVSRFGSIQIIQRSLTTQSVEGLIDGVLVISTLVVMLTYSVPLTLVSVGTVVVYGLLRWSMFDAMREASSEQIVHGARQQSHFMESARGLQSIRLFNRAQERRIGWMNMLAEQFNADVRVSRLSVTSQTANQLLFNAERIVVVWMAALAVLDNRFSVGMLFAYLSYKDQFSQRIASLVDKLFEFRMLGLHAERVADIVLAAPEDDANDVELDLEQVSPSIDVRKLSFRYADGEPEVIKDLDLHIPAGQCVALAGASGCGKTTLIKLLLGLLEPTSGEILVGGIKLNALGLANYRQMIGTVMQEDTLFAGSVGDNIAFFDPSPDPIRVAASARLAAIHAEISAMPMGYNTLVGDIGSGLSGGQKQRILLARALYKMPRILYLDEATSHLDIANEHLVNAAVKGLSLTRILVAHRPETIATAQRVVVLQEGRIIRDLEQAPAAQAAASPV